MGAGGVGCHQPQTEHRAAGRGLNDGKLVVAVSGNSESWLYNKTTLRPAAEKRLQCRSAAGTPTGSGSAIAMMDSIATIKTTTAQRGTVWKWVGISVMCGVLVVLIVIGVVTVVRRRRDTKGKQPDAEKDAGKSTEKATKKDTGKSAKKRRSKGDAAESDSPAEDDGRPQSASSESDGQSAPSVPMTRREREEASRRGKRFGTSSMPPRQAGQHRRSRRRRLPGAFRRVAGVHCPARHRWCSGNIQNIESSW